MKENKDIFVIPEKRISRYKIVCVFWQLLILWRLAIKALPNAKESSNGIFASVVKGSYVLFLLYNLALFLTFWTKSQTMVDVINRVIDVSHDLSLKFRSPPRTRLVQFTAHSSWLFVMGFSFASHVLGGFIALLNNKNNSQDLIFGYGNSTDPNYQLNEMDPGLPKIVHAIIIIANFLNTFNWMISFLYIGTWALVFRQLFIIFYWRIQMLSKCGWEMNLPTEIRTFHKIENLVDTFNEFNGLILMFGSITAVLYISTSVEQAMNGGHSVAQLSQKLHLVLSYIPIAAATLLVSDLHRTANTFSSIVKEEYNRWNKAPPNRDLSEAIFGISIVHHDIVMSNIGFKGLAFFTVTYQFVTTMLGLVITYSLVVIQFFPKADNTSDQPS
ncbi:unnamed protein product [Orchesella dallaii]|uniref:Gustatory receptor n=1 Tax=Orchesella dallaii TaxID=48710 RepID=A0ABP1QCP7_9HEXA